MPRSLPNWLAAVWRFLCSWQGPAAATVLLLIGVAFWAWPERIDRVISADGRHEWHAAEAPTQRQVLWEPPLAIENLLPDVEEPGSFITPRLADNGATLYFSFRPKGGQADIYRSRFERGQWQPAEAVTSLNSAGDDIGPVLSRDGRELYYYSNRPGGIGGSDVYVSQWTGSDWGPPCNLGPAINTPAQEYDPALSPDGLTLFFSSNRTPDMAAAAAAVDEADAWSASLRGRPGLAQFDLYVIRRPGLKEAWSAPQALADLNLPNANEGAPYVSRSGEFLYFASDRPVRAGEPVNLDLYRTRLTGERFVDVENLGPGINTAAHETEPALSPEGFTLVFSSDRERGLRQRGLREHGYGLYQSTAQEVFARTDWDTSRLAALSLVWWKIALLVFLLAALIALLAYYRGWLFAKATAARFLLASLLLHLLIVFLMGIVPLAQEILERAERIRVAEAPAQVFQSDLNRPQAAYEKVADLEAVASAALPELNRERLPAPEPPTMSLERAPTTPVLVRELVPVEIKQKPLTPKEEIAVVELARKTASLKIVEASPTPPEIAPEARKPQEQPLPEAQVALKRQMPAPSPTPKVLTPESKALPAPAIANIDPLQPKPAQPRTSPETPLELTSRRQPHLLPKIVEKLPEVEMKPGAVAVMPRDLPASEAPVILERATTAKTLEKAMVLSPSAPPQAMPTASPKDIPRQAIAATAPADAPLADPFAKLRPQPKPQLVEAAPAAETALQPAPATATSEKPLVEASANLARAKSSAAKPALAAVSPALELPLPGAQMKLKLSSKVGAPAVPDRLELKPAEVRLARKTASGLQLAHAKNLDTPAVYILRDKEVRKKAIEKLGGTQASEAAVERGLEWLATHQSPDGSWSLDRYHVNCKHPQCAGAAGIRADAAGTGLGLLPFLGAGYTHQAGKHQAVVARALAWLLKNQRTDGALMGTAEYRPMYGHGLAAIALCEAYAMTRDPSLREPAQRALDFIAQAQHAPSGGWRYTPNSPGDTSVLGWQVMAMKSGELAGLKIAPKTWEGVRRWLASVESKAPPGGLFGYMGPGPTPAMTAQGLLCLQLMGARRDNPRLLAGGNYLLQHLPRQGVDTSYYWYHAIQVTYALGGKHWQAWNQPLRDMLVATQIQQGPRAGSWDAIDAREKTGGRICATSLRLLMLEVYYRRLPLYRQLEE